VICVPGDATARPHRWRLASRWTALVAGGLLLAMIVTPLLLVAAHAPGSALGSLSSSSGEVLLFLAFGAVGVVIGWHQPRNPIGWILPVSGPVAVAVATLAVAALFNPLRHRVQRIVDRRFNRARYDADQMVASFAARLADATDLDTVHRDLVAVVDQALAPAQVSVWLAGPGGQGRR
jgi:hypothetical protein